ncbi:hypothetical protein [Streptomyces coeruleorubidus]|uniref:Uncharacterized protein n=1 Tax=Streptomyces coeruleorubidus TaxID=116188 RepID=A0A5J6HXU5_STRC4|nr:hypothetical protein [Streptomyces coeruleorubidus]QEV23952.1 hypothetical protein CP976_07190 [Streptomyces coeruleorubidus]GGT85893.1 hypothetical protein GCM10010256_52550 [Streptomyces coeruleorubidus]
MPRIKLANWYGDHKPGDEIDVDEVLLKALRRDGVVAEVLEPPVEPAPTPQQQRPAQPEPAVEQRAEPAAETGRKRR